MKNANAKWSVTIVMLAMLVMSVGCSTTCQMPKTENKKVDESTAMRNPSSGTKSFNQFHNDWEY